ncbi:MAG: S41 family peptidase [Bacteroidia bacterium]|jgi:carboxyl-terminal processing protease
MKRRIKWIAAPAIVLITAISGLSFRDDYFEISKNLDIFTTLFREINLYYVDEVKPGDLMKTGIDAMLESLDPYTNFIPEDDIEDAKFMTTGQYGGIGALIRTKDDYIVISEPYEDAPAAKAGIMAGDIILEVEGKSTKGKSTSDVVKFLKGTPNTPVKILIQRPGTDKPIEKTITREEIKVKNVPYFGMIDDKIGLIKLTGFTEDAGREVRDALTKLKENPSLEGVVLDLRGNPGGLLREAINIVNVFVDKGIDIVSTKGKVKEWDKTYKSLNTPVDLNILVAVLVNRSSASASEIVSGSLQDLDRAVVIGQRSFGKGLVQTSRPLTYNTQIKITTSKYYIPSGRCIQAKDYSHRNEDGSVGTVPDSLIREFKTRNGRKVYDGGGVNPDVSLPLQEYAPVTRAIAGENVLFDFATDYRLKNSEIPAAKSFSVNDNIFEEFVKYIGDKEIKYETESEELLGKLKEAAEKEKYFESVQQEYNALKDKMLRDKKADIQKAKTEISELLADEIVSRYYYQRGRIENSFAKDEELKKAVEILKNKSFYDDILAGRYVEEVKKKGK